VMEVQASSLVMQLIYKQYTNPVLVLMTMSKTNLRPFITITMPLVSPVIFHPSSINLDRLNRLYFIWGEYATLFKIAVPKPILFFVNHLAFYGAMLSCNLLCSIAHCNRQPFHLVIFVGYHSHGMLGQCTVAAISPIQMHGSSSNCTASGNAKLTNHNSASSVFCPAASSIASSSK